eukprot:4343178-Lingulodinium_polyedra.AAC.1
MLLESRPPAQNAQYKKPGANKCTGRGAHTYLCHTRHPLAHSRACACACACARARSNNAWAFPCARRRIG